MIDHLGISVTDFAAAKQFYLEALAPLGIGVVIPVAAYGRAIPQAKWLQFREKTGIPVVIDGAAGFEAAELNPQRHLGRIPVVMSFHATKSFACGEGGAVACTDPALVLGVAKALNFGFHNSRQSGSAGINGKLSEYHAAIGLAELDDWETKKRTLRRVAVAYRNATSRAGILDRLFAAPQICSSYVLFRCEDEDELHHVQSTLTGHRVDFRHWYGLGIHRHAHFADAAAGNLQVTDRLAPLILGLPVAPDLDTEVIRYIVSDVLEGLLRAGRARAKSLVPC